MKLALLNLLLVVGVVSHAQQKMMPPKDVLATLEGTQLGNAPTFGWQNHEDRYQNSLL